MILATLDVPHKRCGQINKCWLVAKCDNCDKIFIIKRCVKAALNQKRHTHNRECGRKAFGSGIIRADINQKLKEKYGVNNIAARPDVRAKIIQTCIDKHGVDHVFKAKAITLKRRETYRKKYGVEWGSQAPSVIEKQCLTISLRTKEEKQLIKERKQQSLCNQSAEEKLQFALRRKATCQERYGVSCVTQRHEHKLRANSPEACAKRHETMKRNGTYRKSKPEDMLYLLLCETYGCDAIQRQATITTNTHWSIDFYIVSINTYVQFDGIYWHGLDRPLEEIIQYTSPRDVVIHKKWQTDRAQDVWFKANGKRLVRITDKEFESQGAKVLEKLKPTIQEREAA